MTAHRLHETNLEHKGTLLIPEHKHSTVTGRVSYLVIQLEEKQGQFFLQYTMQIHTNLDLERGKKSAPVNKQQNVMVAQTWPSL